MIDDEIANTLLGLLKTAFGMPPERLNYEIQDDRQFLLVSIVFDSTAMKSEIQKKLLMAQQIVSGVIPSRDGEYTWMVNAVQGGIVVESVFGGDTASPLSGML